MKKIQILLAEDNRPLREAIALMIEKQSDMHVVANVGSGANILLTMGNLNPNIVLFDIGLQNQNRLQVVKLIKKQFQETKIIVMGLTQLQADVFEFIQAGVSGFILKSASSAEFLKTIRSVYNGAQVLPQNLTGSLFSQIVEHAFSGFKPSPTVKSVRMTKRERQVMDLIADGLTNKQIAQNLHISINTVKDYVHNLLAKLSFHTRSEIAKYAYIPDSYKTPSE
jgi:two-component system response regulator DegU